MSALERPHFWKCNDLQKCAVSSFPSYSITDTHFCRSFSSLLRLQCARLRRSHKVPIIQMMSHMFVAHELNAKQLSSYYSPESCTTCLTLKNLFGSSWTGEREGASWACGFHDSKAAVHRIINLSESTWEPGEKDNAPNLKTAIIHLGCIMVKTL